MDLSKATAHPADSLQTALPQLELHYAQLGELSAAADTQLLALQRGEESEQPVSAYMDWSRKLTGALGLFLRQRRLALIPYVKELMEREDAGHDCRTCSGGCTIRHSGQIPGIREAHERLKEILFHLHAAPVPTATSDAAGEDLGQLRRTMSRIDVALTEVFFIEEAQLIPAIARLQKLIYAHS
jgi:hypothetical protein